MLPSPPPSEPQAPPDRRTLVLTRRDVSRLLGVADCIEAVERAFRLHAEGLTIPPAVLGTHVPGGGFHVKTAGLTAGDRVFAAKVNANFPSNPERHGLPTIQGVIVLFDADRGRPLAILDSIEITSLRTAAATAVAARYLARPDAATITICGCGEQGRSQLRAVAHVRPPAAVFAFDADAARADRYASDMSRELGVEVVATRDLGAATRRSDICVTCTPSRRWLLGRGDVGPGTFVAAVGADSPDKQEIEPALLAEYVVVADVLDQCATIGDLHHALDAKLMRREDVRAELAEVVADRKPGRLSDDEVIVFDSTGTALQDVAAAAFVYERALAAGAGVPIELSDLSELSDADGRGA
ncbi:MAG: ornithine cyclodeaminase family protein [Gemmatimonadaceae bacterium]